MAIGVCSVRYEVKIFGVGFFSQRTEADSWWTMGRVPFLLFMVSGVLKIVMGLPPTLNGLVRSMGKEERLKSGIVVQLFSSLYSY